MKESIGYELLKVTQAAAIGCTDWIGKGDKNAADDAAVEKMREMFKHVDISGTVVIGEGERDEAPMLYIGEEVGKGGEKVDIAVDPLEGTNNVAYNRPGALAVLSVAPSGSLLHAPDTYMDKIAVGPDAKDAIDITASVADNLKNIANALDKEVKELQIIMLDRERHDQLKKEIRNAGAGVTLIHDGDVSAAIMPSMPGSGIDALMGIGAAPEGVLAATALKCLGGGMQGVLKFRSDEEAERGKKMGIKNPDKVRSIDDLVKGKECTFIATGVTSGDLLEGVQYTEDGTVTNSLIVDYKTKRVHFIESIFKDVL
ncbi:class II fructose-bisphosphatase [archaeon]|nr:class II fructose-bisphosphatase [archaeon]